MRQNITDDPTYRIGRLPAANTDVVFVTPDSNLKEAVTLMIHEDFSQLPVMNKSKRNIVGIVSWKSIAKQSFYKKNQSESVNDYMDVDFPILPSNTSLFSALPIIISNDYVIVKNEKNEITGIVTSSDVSGEFQALSEPFLLLGEIENHLRDLLSRLPLHILIEGKHSSDLNRKILSVEDLTFGEYIRLFESHKNWQDLTLVIDKDTFVKKLYIIKQIRNNIMHYRPGLTVSEDIICLRKFAELLRSDRKHSAN